MSMVWRRAGLRLIVPRQLPLLRRRLAALPGDLLAGASRWKRAGSCCSGRHQVCSSKLSVCCPHSSIHTNRIPYCLVWGCSPTDDGSAAPAQDRRTACSKTQAAIDDSAQMLRKAADYLVRLWESEPQEALRTVALILAFPSAATIAAGTEEENATTAARAEKESSAWPRRQLSPQRVVPAP